MHGSWRKYEPSSAHSHFVVSRGAASAFLLQHPSLSAGGKFVRPQIDRVLTPAWRAFVLTPKGATATDAEAVALFRSMLSYAGSYKMEGAKLINHVDSSWNVSRTGSDQVRIFKIDGKTMMLSTPPAPGVLDGRMGRSVLVWEKVD